MCFVKENLFGPGGSAHATYELAKALSAEGARVAVLTSGPVPKDSFFDEVLTYGGPYLGVVPFSKFDMSLVTAEMARKLRWDYDVFHADGSLILARKLMKHAQGVWTTTAHGTLYRERRLVRRYPLSGLRWVRSTLGCLLLYEYERFAYTTTNAVIVAVSSHTRTELIGMGVMAQRVVVIPNGVDPTVFEPAGSTHRSALCPIALNGDPILMVVQGGVPTKGTHVLLDSLKPLLSEFPKLQLIVTGAENDDDYVRYLRARSMQLGIANVSLLPYVSQPELSNLYRTCDVVVIPSLNEGCSLTLLEALACGTPTICTSICGVEDLPVLPTTWTNRVPPGDSLALARALHSVLSDTNAARQNARIASAFIRTNRSWSRISKRMIEFYGTLLADSCRCV